jgi:hydrogenase expression/formation protein HypC
MCLGVPGRVVEKPTAGEAMAWATVEFAGVRRRVCLACVPEAEPGDYVIVHAGIAISKIDAEEAQRVFALVKALGDNEGWSSDVRQ